ncbi:hypothetical protein [Bradyrhizobium embrapense]
MTEGNQESCYSHRQFCSLGPLPPRTPARPDPQVPRERALGRCAHGKIGAFYFFRDGSEDDPAFGFCDIELSVQHVAPGTVRLELYCIADGYQSLRGVGTRHPLRIAVMAGDRMLGVADWHFADVICGHADPMSFAADLDIADELFAQIDRAELMKTIGEARPCE